MKICRITCSYPPYQFGGADIFAENITRELVLRGHPHVVITVDPGKGCSFEKSDAIRIYRFHPANVSTVHSIGKSGLIKQAVWTALDIYSCYSYLKIRSILKKEKPDVVHIHTPIDVTLSAFAAVKSLSLPVVFTAHDYLSLCRRVVLLHGNGKLCRDENISPLCKLYRKFTRRLIENKIDIVTGPSEFVLGIYKKYGFFSNTEAIVIPHGVRLNKPINATDKKTDKQSGGINILYVGGLTKQKGVHILIRAFRGIKDANIRLHIVGYGIYENALRSLAQGDDRVVFYGKVPHNKIDEFYSQADVLVVPSIWYEVLGRIILEGFSFGIPVIGSDIGGISELIKDNYNGFLFQPGNSEQLRQIICDILKNPERLKSLGLNALESAKKYELSGCVDKFIEAYTKAIEINRPGKNLKN